MGNLFWLISTYLIMTRVELLAPAKNLKAIKAASKYADSVYFGIENFNMRMRSENIAFEDLGRITKYCHDSNLKAYLTTNTIIYDSELNNLENLISEAKKAEIDAIIAHDLAAIHIAKRYNIDFHISTQCNVSNSLSARFYEKLGAERIILARELSLEKIKEIKRNLHRSEVEIFIHGAMCTSISGRCYFSQDICGTEEKSANRGNCIQPCRRNWKVIDDQNNEFIYDGEMFLNAKDLCMIEYIPELIEANIDAFKIEGRMRHPHYVEIVSKTYREAMDAYYEGNFTKKQVGRWVTELKRVYNRGFTTGFYFKRVTEEDHQHKSPSNLSHYRYIKLGKVESYDPVEHLAIISLNNGYLTKDDDVIIMGKNTDTYLHQKAEEIIYNGKLVEKTPQGTRKQKIEIKLRVDGEVKGNGEDLLYIFTNKTYKLKKYSL
ncbi:MAG: U32 family peptidase [Candidatus Lokiarchaeota archaeon]|nr:U32 family peptidase [Candidatus Lokiarchaeota archaeon]